MALPQKLPLDLMQTAWATELNPLIKNVITKGNLITNIKIATGVNVINHLLSKQQTGYFITDIDAAVTLYRSQPLNNKTLTLTASGPCTIALWVF